MALIRFVAPEGQPSLEIPGTDIKFVDYFFDVEDTDPRVHQVRYRGSPYGVQELGALSSDPNSDLVSEAEVAAGIRSTSSVIGQAVTERLEPYDTLAGEVTVLRSDVNTLMEGGGGGGGGIVIGNELPVPLEAGSMAARLRTY